MAERPSRIEAGRVGRAHGLDGSFYVTRARPRLLGQGAQLTLAGRSLTVERRAGTDARPIVRLTGIDGRAQAEAVRGEALTVDRADAPALQEGEWWAGDLEGCTVIDGDRRVGVVRGLLELPSCEALEVETSGETVETSGEAVETSGGMVETSGGTILVPMVRDAIRAVDVAAGTIDVDMSFLDAD